MTRDEAKSILSWYRPWTNDAKIPNSRRRSLWRNRTRNWANGLPSIVPRTLQFMPASR